jgi:hypothetical protein
MRLHERAKAMMKRWAWWLYYYLAQWPLYPPLFFCWRTLWVGLGLAIWGLDYLCEPALQVEALLLVPVLLAAWCGDFAWSLGLALVWPWAHLLLGHGVGACDCPLWVAALNTLGCNLMVGAVALLMSALQRHAVRLALERDPRLPQRT